KVLLAATLLIGLQTIRGVIWFTLVALMLVPVALDGVLKPNTRAMRFQLLNRSLIATSLVGVVVAVAAVAAKPSIWFERSYPRGILRPSTAFRHAIRSCGSSPTRPTATGCSFAGP